MPLGCTTPAVLVEQAQDLEGVPALARDGDPFPPQEGEIEGEVMPDDSQVRAGERCQGVTESPAGTLTMLGVERPHEEQIGDAIDQQPDADDLVPPAQASGLQVEGDGARGPRVPPCTRACRGGSGSSGGLLLILVGLGLVDLPRGGGGRGVDGDFHLFGKVPLRPGFNMIRRRVGLVLRTSFGQLGLFSTSYSST